MRKRTFLLLVILILYYIILYKYYLLTYLLTYPSILAPKKQPKSLKTKITCYSSYVVYTKFPNLPDQCFLPTIFEVLDTFDGLGGAVVVTLDEISKEK